MSRAATCTHDRYRRCSSPAFALRTVASVALGLATIAALAPRGVASDHADPIDPFNKERLEGGITDLFVFPVLEDGSPAFPFNRTDGISLATPNVEPRPPLSDEDRARIKRLIVILCVRRALTETGGLRLEPYTYRIHMDHHTAVDFEDTPDEPKREARPDEAEAGHGYMFSATSQPAKVKRPTGSEARARYGGRIAAPTTISDDVTLEIGLKNDASLREFHTTGLDGGKEFVRDDKADPNKVTVWTGVRDDPFIFPAFFQTNIVSMVISIPVSVLPKDKTDWLVWATSHSGSRQIDHVGRSLRTQNPRFEMLNTLPPNQHAKAIAEEHENPSLLRDLALRFNFQSMFAYRAWDQVPDVMVFTTKYPVGFPNGRLLTDDVAALLAQHGDTLLLELSHHVGGWPRRTTNDKEFLKTYPYLAEPWPDRPASPPPSLSRSNMAKLVGIAVGLLSLFVLENWLVAVLYHRRKERRRLASLARSDS